MLRLLDGILRIPMPTSLSALAEALLNKHSTMYLQCTFSVATLDVSPHIGTVRRNRRDIFYAMYTKTNRYPSDE